MSYLLLAQRYWKLIGLGILALLLAVQTVRLGNRTNQLERAQINLKEVRAERDNLIAAAKEAKRINDEQVARIEKEQQDITDDIEAKYEADLARLRAELGKRMRSEAPKGVAGRPEASPDGQAPGEPHAPSRVCISSEQYVRGAETELQLDTLITWVEEQLKVQR